MPLLPLTTTITVSLKRRALMLAGLVVAQAAFSLLATRGMVTLLSPPTIASNNAPTATSKEGEKRQPPPKVMHVLYGLHGNRTALMDEFVVSLKSVLLNAPIDSPTEIHVIVDLTAHEELAERIFPNLTLAGSRWRNPVTITLYPVSDRLVASFLDRTIQNLPDPNVTIMDRVGPGALFRLFAHEVLPHVGRDDFETVLYMDKDVVVFTNLVEALEMQDPTYMLQIGTPHDLCSGIMVINLKKFSAFLPYLSQTNPEWLGRSFDDQAMLIEVKRLLRDRKEAEDMRRRETSNGTAAVAPTVVDLVGDLPERWHVNRAHIWPHHKVRSDLPQGFGMLHFNGVRGPSNRWWFEESGAITYCEWDPECKSNKEARRMYLETWNLAEYYVHLPFEFAKSYGRSLVGDDGGSPLVVRTVCPASTPNCTF